MCTSRRTNRLATPIALSATLALLLSVAAGLTPARAQPPASAPGETSSPPPPPLPPSSSAPAPSSRDGDDVMSPPAAREEHAGEAREDDMLRGPAVPENVARTLVSFDAQGRLAQLDARPEIAAVNLLDDLEPMQRDAVRAAAAERNAALSAFMLDHIDLARESADALAAGNKEGRDRANDIARQLYDKFDPDHQRDPLLTSLGDALSADQLAEVQRLIDEYWSARIDRELRNARDKSDKARAGAQRRILAGAFQTELRAAYERTLRPYRQKIETICQIVEPTDQQREQIREIIIDFVRQTRLQATPEQQRETARKIYEALDEQQRIKLFEAAFARL